MLPARRLRNKTSLDVSKNHRLSKGVKEAYRSDEVEFIAELVREKSSIENKLFAIERNIKLKYAQRPQETLKPENKQRIGRLVPIKKPDNRPRILKSDKSYPLINKLIESHSKIFQLLRQRKANQKYLKCSSNKKLKPLHSSLGSVNVKDMNTKYKNLLISIERNKFDPHCIKERRRKLEGTDPCFKNRLSLYNGNYLQ